MIKEIFINFTSWFNKIRILHRGGTVGTGFYCDGLIRLYGTGKIHIGNNVSINSRFGANPLSSRHCTSFSTHSDGEIIIGDGSGLSNVCFASKQRIIVGNNVLIGAGTTIFDNDFHSISPDDRSGDAGIILTSEVIIENNVFIGASCLILKGVFVGENSILGANSVITKRTQNNEIWAGNPAKVVGLVNG